MEEPTTLRHYSRQKVAVAEPDGQELPLLARRAFEVCAAHLDRPADPLAANRVGGGPLILRPILQAPDLQSTQGGQGYSVGTTGTTPSAAASAPTRS